MTVTPSDAQSRFGRWERYRAAAEGFREYWYPAMASARLGRRPSARRLCGIDLMPENTDPAPLFRPDISIIEWRNFAENARTSRSASAAAKPGRQAS